MSGRVVEGSLGVEMRFKGVSQIVRFNWPFYVIAIVAAFLALAVIPLLPETLRLWVRIAVLLGGCSVALSLLASWHVYDLTNLYDFDYLDTSEVQSAGRMANIHAGFDETTPALQNRFPKADIDTYDFFDPVKHTEASIRRARALHPAPVPTTSIDSSHIPVGENTYDCIFLVFAAHEIRNDAERVAFFRELRVVAKPGASIYVVEHLRDWRNALVYSVGCLHFHSGATWLRTFRQSGWRVAASSRPNPFVIAYQLK